MQNKVIYMHIIVAGQAMRHGPSVYRHLKYVRSLIFLSNINPTAATLASHAYLK